MAHPPEDGPTTMVELTVAAFARHDDRVALIDDRGLDGHLRWTYRDLLDRTYREARRLEGLGVGRGDVLALKTGDAPITFVLRWAANVLGAAVTVLADGFAAPAESRLVATVGARFLLTTTGRLDSAHDVAERVGGVTVADVEATPPPADTTPVPVRAEPDDLASISLTGGSTGVPKGVPRYARAPGSSAAPAGWSDVVQLLCTPVAHIGGTVAIAVLVAGGRVVLQSGFDAGRVLAAIERERVTTIQLMPRLLHQLLDHPALPTTDTSSLTALRIGSAPASPERVTEALERFGPVLGQTYGSIEATNITTISAEELARPELRGSVGRPVPTVTLSIRDDQGRELPAGATGEIWVRSGSVMPGYVNDPDQTATVLRDGWFHTGDLGRLDEAGYLTLVGRSKDVIITEHGWIYPVEVENALVTHPDVAAVGVFALVDADGAEAGAAAAVVPRPGRRPSTDALIAWVVERRGPNDAPSVVHLVDDIPLTPSAKVDRAALADMVNGGGSAGSPGGGAPAPTGPA